VGMIGKFLVSLGKSNGFLCRINQMALTLHAGLRGTAGVR